MATIPRDNFTNKNHSIVFSTSTTKHVH